MTAATRSQPHPVPERVTSLIAGERPALKAGGHDMPVIYPASEETVSVLREADEAEVAAAIAAARNAFDRGPWPRMDINQRKDILYAIRDRLRAHAEELATLEVLNTGIVMSHVRGQVERMTRNYEFFGAPVGLFFYLDRRLGPPQWSDVGMYMQSVMLLAREHGLDTCAQEAWSVWHRTVGDFLGAPPELMLFSGMALGYRDESAPINRLRTERAPLEEIAILRGL